MASIARDAVDLPVANAAVASVATPSKSEKRRQRYLGNQDYNAAKTSWLLYVSGWFLLPIAGLGLLLCLHVACRYFLKGSRQRNGFRREAIPAFLSLFSFFAVPVAVLALLSCISLSIADHHAGGEHLPMIRIDTSLLAQRFRDAAAILGPLAAQAMRMKDSRSLEVRSSVGRSSARSAPEIVVSSSPDSNGDAAAESFSSALAEFVQQFPQWLSQTSTSTTTTTVRSEEADLASSFVAPALEWLFRHAQASTSTSTTTVTGTVFSEESNDIASALATAFGNWLKQKKGSRRKGAKGLSAFGKWLKQIPRSMQLPQTSTTSTTMIPVHSQDSDQRSTPTVSSAIRERFKEISREASSSGMMPVSPQKALRGLTIAM